MLISINASPHLNFDKITFASLVSSNIHNAADKASAEFNLVGLPKLVGLAATKKGSARGSPFSKWCLISSIWFHEPSTTVILLLR